MRYSNIKHNDIANGLGVRVTLWVSGCRHACPGCFNAVAQDFKAGDEFTDDTITEIIEALKPEHIRGLTLLGGEPMDPVNQPEVLRLIKRVREVYGESKDIWSWTGYVYPKDFDSSLGKRARAYTEHSDEILSLLDVLVDGPFVMGRYDVRLRFRGSSNQKIIDMKQTLSTGEIHLVDVGEPPLTPIKKRTD